MYYHMCVCVCDLFYISMFLYYQVSFTQCVLCYDYEFCLYIYICKRERELYQNNEYDIHSLQSPILDIYNNILLSSAVCILLKLIVSLEDSVLHCS